MAAIASTSASRLRNTVHQRPSRPIGNLRPSSSATTREPPRRSQLRTIPVPARLSIAFVAPVDRAAAFQRARLDLDVEALAQQVLQRDHLPGAEQRDAEADVEPRRDLL